MRSVPFLLVLAAAMACSSVLDKWRSQPTPTPQPDRPLPVSTTPEVNGSAPELSVDKDARTISGGILNGSAISLPKPAYPPAARAVPASGKVNVQVTVGTTGSVESAKAVSGHPLLQAAAAAAAREARFSPKLLSGKPVKVSGIITYDFVAPE